MPSNTNRFKSARAANTKVNLEDKYATAKVIRLQIRIKKFLRKIKPNLLKESDNNNLHVRKNYF